MRSQTNAPVMVENLTQLALRYPRLISASAAVGVEASATMPLRTSAGQVIGALGVAWTRQLDFDDTQRAMLESVSGLCAQTIERTGLTDATKDLVSALTVELFPPIPSIDGVDIGARYRSSNDRLAFGGDWYDVVSLSPTRFLLVVGDVVGHGLSAAARMARVRIVLDTLAQQGTAVEEMLGAAERLLRHLGDGHLATLALVEVDLESNTVRHLSAGHPPLVLLTPEGMIERSVGGKRPPLGLGRTEPEPTTHPFGPGAALLAVADNDDDNAVVVNRRLRPAG